jgi:hypothetical protein
MLGILTSLGSARVAVQKSAQDLVVVGSSWWGCRLIRVFQAAVTLMMARSV